MPKSNIDLLEIDLEKVLELLNKAYADEWIAFFQYRTIVNLANGSRSFKFAEKVEEIADEELEHMEEVAERIAQLEGKVILDFTELNKKANCKYDKDFPEDDNDLESMANMILDAEHCAIEVYDELMKATKDKDVVTYNLALHILEEEVDHETQIKQFLGK
ncbi:MAG: ferritin-like domain-containing protein [Asgard group archaeon]|nr:ferritin-like domain-containing protein [Asgard group archaeon]